MREKIERNEETNTQPVCIASPCLQYEVVVHQTTPFLRISSTVAPHYARYPISVVVYLHALVVRCFSCISFFQNQVDQIIMSKQAGGPKPRAPRADDE